MFTLLQKLGKNLREIEGSAPIYQIADDIGPNYHYGLAICFDENGQYRDVHVTEGTDGIIYKRGPSRGSDFTMVSRISQYPEKVIPRLQRNAKKICEWASKENRDTLLFQCKESAEENSSHIVDDIQGSFPEDSSTDKRVFAYWAIMNGHEISPFCSTPLVKEFLLEQGMESYARRKSSTEMRMSYEDGVCSVCGSKDTQVYGSFSAIACYNLDKQGMISGGFGYGQAARNFPVCQECILDILGAKTYVEENLQFFLAGMTYWLLPDATTGEVYRTLLEELSSQETRQSMGKAIENITHSEQELLGYIATKAEEIGETDAITLNLFFFTSSQASWKITGEIRRILPSRVQQVYRAKQDIESMKELRMNTKEMEDKYYYTLVKLHPFCGVGGKQSDRKFLTYLDAIFSEKSLSWRTVITDMVNGILSAQRENPVSHRFTVRDAWATIRFLQKINVIELEEGSDAMDATQTETNRYHEYMKENPDFFGHNERKAAFLTGAYVGAVLYAQYKDRKSHPFAKKYLGRKLDRKRLVYLYDEAKTKLTQYKALGLVADIDPLLADTWVKVGDTWSLSKEDTTFAFNLGQTLSQKLAEKRDIEDLETQEV